MHISRKFTGATLALGLATAAIAGAGTATAQNAIPGDATDTVVVRVQPALGTVTVNGHTTGNQVTGSFTNRTGVNLACQGYPDNTGYSGAVAPATVVRDSLSYYRTFQLHPHPGMAEAVTMAGSTININARMQEVPGLFPGGSIAPTFGPSFAAQSAITEAYMKAKVQGHTGQIGRFDVNNNATANWTANLSAATSGARQNFDAGAILLCSGGGQYFAFAGYEAGTTPPADNPQGNLQSGSLGRF